MLALLLLACPHVEPRISIFRVSRPAAGTLVGITAARAIDTALIDGAYAEIERWEAQLSEWRPGSLTYPAAPLSAPLTPRAAELFRIADAVHRCSDGAFSIAWRGGSYRAEADWLERTPGTVLDLGGILKGFLAEQAATWLAENGAADFVIDVGGDVVARGDLAGPGTGWPVIVAIAGTLREVVLHDQALSSSANDQQPLHIVDARTQQAVGSTGGVWVVADSGTMADAIATASFAKNIAPQNCEGPAYEVHFIRP